MGRVGKSVVAGLALVLCAALPAATQPADALPSVECVRALRSARVARMSEDPAAELDHLRAAETPCGSRPELLIELLTYARVYDLPETERESLEERLLVRLRDEKAPAPTAVAQRLIYDRDTSDELLAAAAEAFSRRLEAGATVRILDLQAAAFAMERLGRLEEATEIFEAIREAWPSSSIDWSLARLYEERELWLEAAKALQRVEGEAWHTFRVVGLLSRAGAEKEAMKLFEELYDDGLPAAGLALDFAWALRDGDSDTEAERFFRMAAEGDDDLRELSERKGEAQRQAQQALLHLYAHGEEREQLRAELRSAADDEDPFELYERGTEMLTSGQLEPAFELLSRAAPAIADLEAAWFNLALVAYRLERWPEAAEAYGKAAEINGQRPDVWFFRGLALVNAERWSEAVPALEEALRLDPERALAHYHLSKCYAELGDAEAASRHLQSWNASREQK